MTYVTLFVYDNLVYVLSRFMPRGVRKAWAGVWSCGAVFPCLCWRLSVTSVCCCGCVDILCLRYGWQLQVYCRGEGIISESREVLWCLGFLPVSAGTILSWVGGEEWKISSSLYNFSDKLYPTWWWTQQHWSKNVVAVDKLHTPDNIEWYLG